MAASNATSKVDFTPSNFTALEIRYEIPALLVNSSVKVLHLPTNRLDDACTKCIAMMFDKNVGPPIEELVLSKTEGEESVDRNNENDRCYESSLVQIVSSLRTNIRIKKLVISEASLTPSEISAIATILYDIKSLRTLVIRQCGIDHKGATKISCALASNKSLESFDFSNNPCSNRGASAIGVALDINKTLKKVKLSGTRMGIEGAVAIATAITSHPTIEVLDVSRNPIGDMGVSKLALALKSNKAIRQISLRHTSMSDIGALCIGLSLYDPRNLSSLLQCNNTVRYLNLNNNEVSKKYLLDIETYRNMNLLLTEKESVRQKVSYFLQTESNATCFGSEMTVGCMPHLLSAMGKTDNGLTTLFNLLKHLHMPALFQSKLCDPSADSIFSTENSSSKPSKVDGVPAFIQLPPVA
ncbi:hypothetical protein ACHAWF_005913 [Thalassiosira exigua]